MSSEEDEKLTLISSGRKEIAFDEQSGRFFETNINQEDCIPEEEFCVIDNDSGNAIRLTVEEKERIFLDALQVSRAMIPLSLAALAAHCIVGGYAHTLVPGLLQQWSPSSQ